MEWMPIRQGPNMSGAVDITSITQVIEWGDLASIVAVDTRLAGRSLEPTLADTFSPFGAAAFSALNISAYYDETSEVRQTIEAIAQGTKAEMSNPDYTMLGEENMELVRMSRSNRQYISIFVSFHVMMDIHQISSLFPLCRF